LHTVVCLKNAAAFTGTPWTMLGPTKEVVINALLFFCDMSFVLFELPFLQFKRKVHWLANKLKIGVYHFTGCWQCCPVMLVLIFVWYCGLRDEIKHQQFNVLVTTYEYLMNKNDRPKLCKIPWHYIIIDEGHRIKNASCKLNAELRQYQSTHRLLLTGTPIQVRLCIMCLGCPFNFWNFQCWNPPNYGSRFYSFSV
jgi:hypothetical protein